ncbi:Thioesterase-like superfamily protein [Rhodococcus jostii]|uniref:Thioesterase-like superfamily protein n=2 Tax=Rhodococcus jostii TaxID=132919 RepID=A0A1H5DJT1_RHOJO|nr:Thioesterase-like superfamily protein [Rhodococcus jostii]
MSLSAFYRVDSHVPASPEREILSPLPRAFGGWGSRMLRGMAVSGVLARAAERRVADLGRSDLSPARWTLDLFRPAGESPCSVATTVLRQGRRLCLLDATLMQAGAAVARGTALFLRPTELPHSGIDVIAEVPQPPPPIGGIERVYRRHEGDWLTDGAVPRDAHAKSVWHFPVPIVEGEDLTPFQAAAAAADITNAVANAGPDGLAFINADLTMNIVRRPTETALGMTLAERFEGDGLSAGVATMFDSAGGFGSVSVSCLQQRPIVLQ